MALDAFVYQQEIFGYNGKDIYNLFGGGCFDFEMENEKGCFDFLENQTENFLIDHHVHEDQYWENSYSSMAFHDQDHDFINDIDQQKIQNQNNSSSPDTSQKFVDNSTTIIATTRSKRSRQTKNRKNKEEIENQRMTHIAVERNRRKQMNEYLSLLRSLMPESYVQRGDQASIIGGAINYVKELEHRLHFLETEKEKSGGDSSSSSATASAASSLSSPFADFFTFPQYSTTGKGGNSVPEGIGDQTTGDKQSTIADIEVTMVESHANLKIRSRNQPKQLLKVVSGLHTMRLTVLHLNVSTVEHFVLYSLNVKVEDDCKVTSVDDIATAVHQLLCRINQEENRFT